MSQREAAEVLGVDPMTVNRDLKGVENSTDDDGATSDPGPPSQPRTTFAWFTCRIRPTEKQQVIHSEYLAFLRSQI